MKIKELLNLEELDRVIDIDSFIDTEDKARDTIEKYIITSDMKKYMKKIASDLNRPKHHSYQVIGNYGSGKSHFLAVIAALLDNPALIDSLQDDEVKESFKNHLNRDYAVIQFELQPSKHTLSEFFYDRLEVKLKEKYNIIIPPINTNEIYDHKEKVKEILGVIKTQNPRKGLMVIIDEISDFLKTKPTKEMKYADTQFMRVLAQASNQMDFILMGSMQENIFSSNEFVEEAQSFGRTSERYEIISISKEDIKKVLSRRALRKDIYQVEKLKELLTEYGQQIPQVQNKLNEYVDLFPVHPYVIDIFNQLPYFANRGILEFAVDQVKEILDQEFPVFITFDKIFDKIASNHSIKTLDEITPVINAVETLGSKIDLLRSDRQEDARKIIKALAMLNLYGKTSNNGANPEELANELMIISSNVTNVDRIKIILNQLREVTDGQFINRTENDYYFLDLEHDIDYDVVIQRKAENLYEGAEDAEILKLIKENFELESESEHVRVFEDYSYWKDNKSFRKGSFIYDDGSSNVEKGEGDFNFVFVSPYKQRSQLSGGFDTAILNIDYHENLDRLLKNIAAVTSLKKGTGYPQNVMNRKQREFIEKTKNLLLHLLLETKIENGGQYETAGQLLAQEPDNLNEYFYEVKSSLFNKTFNEQYPLHPQFLNRLSPENIQGEVERTIKEILKTGEKITVSNAQNLLLSLELLDNDNYLDTSKSKYIKVILDELTENEGKNVKVHMLVEKLATKPFGLQKELTLLLLIVLTHNGEANLKQRGGRTITASDLEQFFSTGIKNFKEVPYIMLETDFPVEEIIRLFKVLDLNPGLIRQKKERPEAVRWFKNRILEIKEKIVEIDGMLDKIKSKPDDFIEINKLLQKREGIEKSLPMNTFLQVNTVTDFQKVVLKEIEIERKIKPGLNLVDRLLGYLNDFEEFIYDKYTFMVSSLAKVKEYSVFFSDDDIKKLEILALDCKEVMGTDALLLLLDYDNRRLLKGKLELYQRTYKAIYYRQHHQKVGNSIDWDKLDKILKNEELIRLKKLKDVRGINSLKFNRLMMLIHKIENVKCNRLKEEHLEEAIKCPSCSFPESDDQELHDINQTLDDIWNNIFDIKDEWEEQIFSEIEHYEDNISKLISSEQNVVNEILAEKRLPKEIDNQVITALNNLFSELKEVEISNEELRDLLFESHSVLDYEMFVSRLESIKQWVLEKGDRDNIRIKMKEIDRKEFNNG